MWSAIGNVQPERLINLDGYRSVEPFLRLQPGHLTQPQRLRIGQNVRACHFGKRGIAEAWLDVLPLSIA
jgi:hypothetical protein